MIDIHANSVPCSSQPPEHGAQHPTPPAGPQQGLIAIENGTFRYRAFQNSAAHAARQHQPERDGGARQKPFARFSEGGFLRGLRYQYQGAHRSGDPYRPQHQEQCGCAAGGKATRQQGRHAQYRQPELQGHARAAALLPAVAD